jgi:hypothetical protein
VAGQEHELEAVGNLVDAVLDGDASHQVILVQKGGFVFYLGSSRVAGKRNGA